MGTPHRVLVPLLLVVISAAAPLVAGAGEKPPAPAPFEPGDHVWTSNPSSAAGGAFLSELSFPPLLPIPEPVRPYRPGDTVWLTTPPTGDAASDPEGSFGMLATGCQRVPSSGYIGQGVFANTTFQAGAAAARQPDLRHIDLAGAGIDGRVVLGRTVAGVTAALGRPGARVRGAQRYTLLYGRTRDGRGWHLRVLFSRWNGALRAHSLVIANPDARDVRIPRPLRLTPHGFRLALEREYPEFAIQHFSCTVVRCRGDATSTTAPLGLGWGYIRSRQEHYLVLYHVR